jgi:hypothetical protein
MIKNLYDFLQFFQQMQRQSQSGTLSDHYIIGHYETERLEGRAQLSFFVIPFYLQSVLVHSANCVKDVYSGM